jgi:transketolase
MSETADAVHPSYHVTEDGSLDRLAIDTIRTLAMDAVQKANSGHPGTPMSLAPIAETLWTRFLHYDPKAPQWPNRDRFILSCGHASMLLYSLIHLSGTIEVDKHGKSTGKPAVSLDDIKQFRQFDSKTPGHPEYRYTTGVETTTGPLGAGCGNSVGFAMAERWLASHFNKPGFDVFDHKTYVFCSDGDLMEGVASEAASIAGHLALSNLCWVYDNNNITIEGETEIAFTEDVAKRFEAYGWNVIKLDDAEDTEAFAKAIETFKATTDKPTFIDMRSVIGIGFPTRAGTHKAHSDAPGDEEIKGAKKSYGWPEDAQFLVPPEAKAHFEKLIGRNTATREAWEKMVGEYKAANPDLGKELDTMLAGKLPEGWEASLPVFPADAKGIASREAGGKVLNAIAPSIPWLVGGAADLAPSTKTDIKEAGSFEPGSYGGNNLHYGIREHGMGAAANGIALSYLRTYTATFFVFSDYMRPPIRLAAIMELPTIFVFTHDSIGVGEDGPTHQPIEQLASLRAIPGLDTIRPGDANETSYAWKAALESEETPTVLVFSRQAMPTLDRDKYAPAEGVLKGGYVLTKDEGTPDVILIATGTELGLAVAAGEALAAEGTKVRVVSLPSFHRFERQDQAYKDSVLPPAVTARVAIEQGAEMGWDRYVGSAGSTVTMATFGASAPLPALQKKFGFTVDNVVKVARKVMEK